MKSKLRLVILIALINCLLACSSNNFRTSFSQFEKSTGEVNKIPEFKYDSWELKNGLKVYHVHDPELPLFSASIFLRRGSFWEQADQVGLYSAVGDNMRYGGAGAYAPLELDAVVEKYAAALSTSFGQEFGSASVAGLSSDKEALFGLLNDVLRKPKFDKRRLELWKSKALEGIKRRSDDPNTIASMSTRALLLSDTVYGRFPQSKDIKSINQSKLIELHKEAVVPNGAILAISGDINKDQAKQLSEKYFSDWQPSSNSVPELAVYPAQKNTGIFFIEKDLKQATVIAAHLGPDRHTDDIYKIDVFNQYFGSGGFGSALMKRVRSELGLAYGIYGAILPGYPKGRALIHVQTKPESVGLALKESLNTLEKLKTSNLDQAELSESKKIISNNFIFNFTSPGQVLGRKVEYQLTGFPEDYDSKYLEAINSVNESDIKQIANNHWHFKDFVIVVVGPKAALESLKNSIKELPEPIPASKIQTGKFIEVAAF